MDALRKEIDDEIKRTRLDKTRLYDLLVKIVDQCGGSAGEGPAGPAGPVGPAGPAGPKGPACECKCAAKVATATTTTTTPKKAAPKKKAASTPQA